jgi:hypothetical protein
VAGIANAAGLNHCAILSESERSLERCISPTTFGR